MSAVTPAPAPDLDDRIAGVLAAGGALLPGLEHPVGADPAERLTALVREVLEVLATDPPPASPERVTRLGVAAQDLRRALHERAAAHRRHLLAQVHDGLGRLSRIGASDELLDHVCAEVARSCGLQRVMLSRVVGETWTPWIVHFGGDPERQARMEQAVQGAAIPLDEAPIERAIVARGRPAIVADAATRRVYGPLITIARSTSYVVAPITPAGRVVGLLHGDHGPDGARVDLLDREVLWTFAEGVGRIYGRVELHERLRAQRGRVRQALEVLEQTMAHIDEEEIELVRDEDPTPPAGEGEAAGIRPAAAIDALLTDREREVMALMVRGANNAAIAERLVIREGTVKSHVKHILRKVGAINRAEAISRYAGHT